MTKCVNCNNAAEYTYPVSAVKNLHYCGRCLPKFLSSKKAAGQLPLLSAPVVVEEPIVKSTKKKAVDIPVEESVVTDASN